jgi:hypothetical protein
LKRFSRVNKGWHVTALLRYQFTPELIERVRSGSWNPDANRDDREQHNAMAARGYWQAFQAVQKSIRQVLNGENPGQVAEDDHGDWYRELFAPSVAVGLLKPSDLAGYRTAQVYIRKSMHVPLNSEAMRDALPAFFELLRNEVDPAVRVVLGHFVFVYIHPNMDGNGRIGRLMMNIMMASAGYPWTVIPVSERDRYLQALESASVEENIVPFAKFLAGLVRKAIAK